MEPGDDTRHASAGHSTGSDGADDALREEEMIILRAQGDHHYPEHVNESSADEKPFRAELVKHKTPLHVVIRRTILAEGSGGEHTTIGKKFNTHCIKLVIQEMVDEEYWRSAWFT